MVDALRPALSLPTTTSEEEKKRLLILKVGGSLVRSGRCVVAVQTAIERCKKQSCALLVVMGGGELADVVRKLSAQYALSESAEHDMSLLAMEQHALLVAAALPALKPCSSVEQGFSSIYTYTPGILIDLADMYKSLNLEHSKSITSDSISLCLADAMSAYAQTQHIALEIEVLLLKTCQLDSANTHNAQALADKEIVDAAFPRFALKLMQLAHASWRVANVEQWLSQEN